MSGRLRKMVIFRDKEGKDAQEKRSTVSVLRYGQPV